ncbi:MAG: hypothetical protein IKE18_04930 [Oscillospiraceae bacterium]|nr:hypothetical protein [Oscillospiraceae bacterium]
MDRTELERSILEKMAEGRYDRQVGNNILTIREETATRVIEDGIPKLYVISPEGERNLMRAWETDEEKLSFVATYGFLFWDADIRKYLRIRRCRVAE